MSEPPKKQIGLSEAFFNLGMAALNQGIPCEAIVGTMDMIKDDIKAANKARHQPPAIMQVGNIDVSRLRMNGEHVKG